MSAERVAYLDSSALVKLAVAEAETDALRRFLRRRRCASSALSRTEVSRALLPLGEAAVRRGHDVLSRVDLIRVSDRVLIEAGRLLPVDLRSLDAIHLATVQQLGEALSRLVTYDQRMLAAAKALHLPVASPT